MFGEERGRNRLRESIIDQGRCEYQGVLPTDKGGYLASSRSLDDASEKKGMFGDKTHFETFFYIAIGKCFFLFLTAQTDPLAALPKLKINVLCTRPRASLCR